MIAIAARRLVPVVVFVMGAAALGLGCAATAPSPRIDVMQTGGVYPARPPGCALGVADINDPTYNRIGMIAISGGTIDAATVESLRTKACAIGGDALYMNMSGEQMRAYTVLRRRPATAN